MELKLNEISSNFKAWPENDYSMILEKMPWDYQYVNLVDETSNAGCASCVHLKLGGWYTYGISYSDGNKEKCPVQFINDRTAKTKSMDVVAAQDFKFREETIQALRSYCSCLDKEKTGSQTSKFDDAKAVTEKNEIRPVKSSSGASRLSVPLFLVFSAILVQLF